MKQLKILLLVILLALVPQASATATIFIDQKTQDSFVSLAAPHYINQTFLTYNYANLSTYRLDNITIYGSCTAPCASTTVSIKLLNDTLGYVSSTVSSSWDSTVKEHNYNFSDTYLNKNTVYNLTITISGTTDIYWFNGNPYADGYAVRVVPVPYLETPMGDLYFNIGLEPHDNVGNWTFNQASGAYANDSSGFNNNGTIFGDREWSTNLVNGSVNGTSLNFTGANYVNMSNAISLNFSTRDFTVTGWAKITGSSYYMGKTNFNPSMNGFEIDTSTGGGVPRFIIANGVTSKIALGTTTINDNKWHMITGERNGDTLSIYLDNVLEGSISGASGINVDSIADFYIARAGQDDNFGTAKGTLDEWKAYNYALNSSERTIEYQRFQPVPAYPVGGLQINPSSATAYVNFSWHDSLYPQDEIIIATDSGFTNVIHDAFHSTDYANLSLTVGTTYYWKVRQFDSGTGSYGNTSAIQKFTLGTVPTFIRVNVFDELNQTPLININATLTSIATNVSVNLSSAGSYVNFTNPNITDGVEYLAQIGAIGYTTRNILITSPGNYSIYLPYTATPTGVSQINFVESDYTGLFPYQSTKLMVQKVINTTLVNISSNYFDATGLSTAQLINGQLYQLVVESTVSTRVLGSFIPTASATQTLLVGTFTLQPSGAFNGLNYTFTYNSNQSIVLQWNDPNNEIISLNETITNQLNAIVLQLITSVHSGQTTYLIANTSSKYLVQLNISTVHYGYLIYSNWYNPALFTSANASLAPTPGPNNYVIPFGNTTAIGNQSNANAPIPQWVKNFFSVSVLVIMALLFNREHVLRGAVVVSLFSLVFWLTGMLVFDVGYITTGAILGMGFVISIVALLAESNRG